MAKQDKLIDLDAEFICETALARKFDFGDDDKVWLPKSQHEWSAEDGKVTLPERVAMDKGLI